MRLPASAKVRRPGIRTTRPADGFRPWRLASRNAAGRLPDPGATVANVFSHDESPAPCAPATVGAIDTTPALRARNRNMKLWHNSGASAQRIQSLRADRHRSGAISPAAAASLMLDSASPLNRPRNAGARRRPRQRHPRARDGRRRGGEVRSSRHADGHGGDRRRAVDAAPAAQPGQPALARSRPLRAVERPRLDAAVRAAASDRLRPADRRACAASASCIRRRRAIRKSA